MRSNVVLGLMVLLGAGLAAVQSHRQAAQAVVARQSEHERVLNTMINSVRADTLFDAIEQSANKSGCKIRLEKTPLLAARIDQSTKCPVLLFDVTLKEFLTVTCELCDSQTQIAWQWEGDTIVLSTSDDICQREVTLRTYDVRDLLASIEAVEFQGPSYDQTGLSGGGLFGTSDGSGMTRKEACDQLIRLIEEVVSSETWADNGGTTGHVREIDDRLLIKQSAKNHQQIANLLQRLREDALCD